MQDRDLYRLFLHLCASLSFTRTAEDCHVSPATMSRAVQRLEAATGHRLLDRGPHGVALTEQGHRFRGYAAQALQLWESYRGDELTNDHITGSLRVFASVTACQSLLPDLLAPIRDAHPGVQICIRTGDAAAALAFLDDGEADLAVAVLPSRIPATLLARPVARTPLVLVRTRPSPSGTEPLAFHDRFVLPRGGLVRDAANRWFRRIGATPHIAAEADGHEALLTLVTLGYGTGIVPDLVLRHGNVRNRLHTVSAPSSPGELNIGVCVRRADLHRPLVAAAWAVTGHDQLSTTPKYEA
ncbi:HTH-type transcriptional activator IlvY [Actinoplanes sp. NPDC089786]|uniref:HTH-type transcriptional activator IlvY n=1 Tax=Actinoplanes sp. NPDC089786 TaxID=3155185 RepID=UPI00343F612D